MQKQKVIIIGGPTASGKTKLSVELAKKVNGEIVSADSMQIYKEMDIGTAKVEPEEMQGIKHYLLDFLEPNMRYSVADFKKDAKNAIREIIKKGKMPICVGGTGLYIDSLIYEIDYPDLPVDLEFRKQLEKTAREEGLSELYEQAKRIDIEAASKISPNDEKRIIRIIEIYYETGKTKTELEKNSKKDPEFDYIVFAIDMPREELYERINKRVDIMIENGLIQEVQNIYNKYNEFPTSMQALGYKEVVEYLDGKIDKETMIEKIKMETRRYAKRQLTWFRKNKQTIWLNGNNTVEENIQIILEEINKGE